MTIIILLRESLILLRGAKCNCIKTKLLKLIPIYNNNYNIYNKKNLGPFNSGFVHGSKWVQVEHKTYKSSGMIEVMKITQASVQKRENIKSRYIARQLLIY